MPSDPLLPIRFWISPKSGPHLQPATDCKCGLFLRKIEIPAQKAWLINDVFEQNVSFWLALGRRLCYA